MVEKALGSSSQPDPELSGLPGVLIMKEWIHAPSCRRKLLPLQEVRYRYYEVGLHPEPDVTPGSQTLLLVNLAYLPNEGSTRICGTPTCLSFHKWLSNPNSASAPPLEGFPH